MGYARILKDNNGKLSGYRECDGEVAFMPEPLKHWMMVLECMALKVMAEMQNLCTFLLILRKPAMLSD